MSNSSIAGPLARHTTSPSAMRAALHRPNIAEALASNQNLTDEIWFAAWPAKPRIAVEKATALVSRPLSAEQVEHAVRDSRVSILKHLLRFNSLHAAAADIVIGHKNAAQLADVVLDAEDGHPYDEELRRKLADAAQGMWLLKQLRFMDADVVKGHLARWPEWSPRWSVRRNNELARLADAHPELINDLASSPFIDIVSAAAGCRHLRDGVMQMTVIGGPEGRALTGDDATSYKFALLKLANLPAATTETIEVLAAIDATNPSLADIRQAAHRRLGKKDRPTVTEAYEDVSDPAVLRWLIKRALPSSASSFADAKDKPLEVEALAYNPNLADDQVHAISCFFSYADGSSVMVNPQAAIAALTKNFAVEVVTHDGAERFARPVERRDHTVSDVANRTLASSMATSPDGVAAWLDLHGLSDSEWDSLFSIADSNPKITAADLLALARTIALA